MSSYVLGFPPKIMFGAGEAGRLAENIPIPKGSGVLLVTGRHALKDGLADRLRRTMDCFRVESVAGVTPEPPLEEVDNLIRAGREWKVAAVVAAGGGSVIDAAKTAACLIPLDGWTGDYFSGEREIPGPGLFFAALPTTAGTGAEITKNAVLTDTRLKIKKSIRHDGMTPSLAIIDPELTLSASPGLTAASGLDAFTQAVESHTSRNANNTTRALAEKAVSLLAANLPAAFKRPSDLAARTGMAEGSMISAMAFSQSGLGAVHGLAHPVGSLLGVPHGVACAILLSPVLRFNLPSCGDSFAALAAACGRKSQADFLDFVDGLRRELGVPCTFASYGMERGHFEFIVKNCRSNSMRCNPREMSDRDVEELLGTLL